MPLPPPTLKPYTEVAPRHLHPLSPLVTTGLAMVRMWPVALLALARGSLGIIVVFVGAVMMWRWLVWARTTWSLGADGLVVRSGILWRSVQTVPPQRVQQVEVRQALRHRATGLAVVRIGLAGGGESNQVELEALGLEEAERLRTTLDYWRGQRSRGDESAETPDAERSSAPVATRQLFRVELWQLVAAGLTGRSLWLAPLAALAAFVQFVSDARLDDEATEAVRSRIAETSPVITVVVVMVIALVFAAATTVISNFGLTVSRSGDDLTVRRGLIEQRSAAVPRHRVQTVELATNLLRDRAGLASVEVRTADLGGSGDSGAASTSIPIGAREDLEQLIDELLVGVSVPARTERHPRAAVRREILRRMRRLAPIAGGVSLLVSGIQGLVIGAAIGVLAAIVTGWIAGRRMRSGWSDTVAVTERGAVVWRRWIVPIGRVQSVAVLQNPFQRRAGLVSVRLDLAGSPDGVLFRDLSAERGRELVAVVHRRLRPTPAD